MYLRLEYYPYFSMTLSFLIEKIKLENYIYYNKHRIRWTGQFFAYCVLDTYLINITKLEIL